MTYEWDFGDGNNSTSQNPSHIYNKSGEYQVSLLVTDMKYEAHQSSITVVVGRPPIAIILSPMEGELFSAGKQIRLLGEAYVSRWTKTITFNLFVFPLLFHPYLASHIKPIASYIITGMTKEGPS